MVEKIAIVMLARLWSVVDGSMDNAVSNAIDSGGEEACGLARTIRQAGWDQVPWAENNDWPPMDQEITISLTLKQWQFALADLRKNAPIYEDIISGAHPEHRQDYVDSLELGNRAADVITAAIGEPDAGRGR